MTTNCANYVSNIKLLLTRKKHLFLLLLVSIFSLSFPSCDFYTKYDKEGYNFLLNTLKAPSEAKMLGYIDKVKLRKLVKDNYGVTYSKNIDFEFFNMECMNGFGGREQTEFVVVYWKNKAVLCDEMPVYMFSSADGLNVIRHSLNYLGLEDSDTQIEMN